ncbi:MAG: tetratricopeptide repeat protein [Bacteroidales bacterium]|nr:tetratricopeptide repeat protein [Bacteroidales bacterium]
MKKIVAITYMLFAIALAFAQTQNGVVKTRGRMVGGKLVPGKLLSGATVQVDGCQAILAKDGKFSFPVTGGKFTLKSVTKQGYRLVDVEACRQYSYSATPLQIVMEEPSTLQADQLAKERALRRELERRLQQREEEIEGMNVSLQEKNRMLEELDQQREDNEKIVKEMAQYYATLDYDQLDEFQRQVSQLLENGELERADSLLRTRGSMTERIRQLRSEQQAEAKEETEIAQQQQYIDQSLEGVQKKIDITAAECDSYIELFKKSHQYDSAARYMAIRAELDTTKYEWQNEASNYFFDYMGDYDKTLKYNSRVWRLKQQGVPLWMGGLFRQNGVALMYKGLYDKAAECQREAHSYYSMMGMWPGIFWAKCERNLGDIEALKGDFEQADKYYNEAVSLLEEALVFWDSVTFPLPEIYTSMAYIFGEQNKYSEAMRYIKDAVRLLVEKDTCEYQYCRIRIIMAAVVEGRIQMLSGKTAEAQQSLLYALERAKTLVVESHPYNALIYYNLGCLQKKTGQGAKAMESFQKAASFAQTRLGPDHHFTQRVLKEQNKITNER